MTDTVGIVIVSHSKDIAKGTADMVLQMVGTEVKVAFCGGNSASVDPVLIVSAIGPPRGRSLACGIQPRGRV